MRPMLAMAGAGNSLLPSSWDFLSSESGQANHSSNSSEKDLEHYHQTVLLDESVHFMTPGPGKVIVDGTLGGGGHTEQILAKGATVYGIDRDPEAREYAQQRLSQYSDKFHAVDGNYAEVGALLAENGVNKVDGILVDIGVSSRQFDAAERGFSFSKEGPLDMRMGPSCLTTAEQIINTWSEQDLAKLFWTYGEERASRKIARYLCTQRKQEVYKTTTQLADAIETIMPRRGKKIHPATKVFQALRIEVNDELGALQALLENAHNCLKPGGRLAVISFHSLEDRMVKRHFRETSKKEIDRPEWPAPKPNPDYHYNLLTKKPVTASAEEQSRNPRSRSAVLRAVEKV